LHLLLLLLLLLLCRLETAPQAAFGIHPAAAAALWATKP
jgi:hypothetical protein